ncbi:unnamed protein product, partial [Prorocentrum cordatum]
TEARVGTRGGRELGGPYDDAPADRGAPPAPCGGTLLDDEGARAALRERLAAARDRFDATSPAAPAAAAGPAAVEEAPSEGEVKKRSLAEVLAERSAKVAKGSGAEPARAASEQTAAAAASGGAAGDGATGDGANRGPQELGSAGLATKRAHCSKLAQEPPGKLSETTLAQMADFLGAAEEESSVDPASAWALRHLPQNQVRRIGLATCREMRTLVEATDDLPQGKIPQALDLLTQRLKVAQ